MAPASRTTFAASSEQPSPTVGSALAGPRWLLAELTYRCPLRCFYCSNPLELGTRDDELSTDEWLSTLRQARALGAVQLGFSGGEPLARGDLEALVTEARTLGFYTNLVTSGIGLTSNRLAALKKAGLDHVQLSMQAADAETNDRIGGATTFARKVRAAAIIKAQGYPMVLNVVLHRHNIDATDDILALAEDLDADYLELANVQYDGWALKNREYLLPTRDQVQQAERTVRAWREKKTSPLKVFYVVPDYFEDRPKPCANGWGTTLLVVSPDGTALPCHGARKLTHIVFPNVRRETLSWIWRESKAFNHFRGEAWMPEPCRSCPEKTRDFAGCRCQAFALTGNAANTDPVCSRSPYHHLVVAARQASFATVAVPRGATT